MKALLAQARQKYHRTLVEQGIFSIDSNGIPSNADKASRLSRSIAQEIAQRLNAKQSEKVKGQTAGTTFEEISMTFLRDTFPHLQHIRPGAWEIIQLGNVSAIKTSSFAQYEHLSYLAQLTQADATLAASIGKDYLVAPDVVIYRHPLEDDEINALEPIVDDSSALKADLRKKYCPLPILHASISAKWTMRSDRAQNSRTEALGLIRNRKGRLPHIVVITAEPMPGRIASLALGTGDIDCVYHFALYELKEAVLKTNEESAVEALNGLIEGKRLKDISDLPLDLTV